eukprot:gene7084-11247_t
MRSSTISLLVVTALLQVLFVTSEFKEHKYCDLTYNSENTTYGEHFTLLKGVPRVGKFLWKIYDSPYATITKDTDITEPIKKILAYTSNVDETKITTKIIVKPDKSYNGILETPNTLISMDSKENLITIRYELRHLWEEYNAMRMIVDFLGSKNVSMEYLEKGTTDIFTETDLLAEGFGVPVIMHHADILHYEKTKFQRAMIINTKTAGKCLILDQITQYCEALGNYTNVFYDQVEKTKPKDILMIGGGDLVILKKIAKSELWNDINSFTLVEIDKDVVEISKKFFHQKDPEWLNDPKIKIKIEDANKYVLDLDKNVQYDAILMDTTDPEIMISLKLFQRNYFKKLLDYHMKPHTYILMQYGLVEEKTEDVHVNEDDLKYVRHPKSSELFDTKPFYKYTPEYIGHTVFYLYHKNKKHSFFKPMEKHKFDLTITKNGLNTTYGTHLTILHDDYFPLKNFFKVKMQGVDLDQFSNEKLLKREIERMIEFTSSEKEKDFVSKLSMRDGMLEGKISFDKAEVVLHSLDENSIMFELNVNRSDINFFNALELIVHHFNPKEYTVEYKHSNEDYVGEHANYTKGDLVARTNDEYTFIHGAKILEWTDSKYKALFFDSKELGKGLIMDSTITYVANSPNHNDFYYQKIKESKGKKILIFGDESLSILARIAKSNLFQGIEKISVVNLDKKINDYSKKYLFPDFENWFDSGTIEIIYETDKKFIYKPNAEKYDIIIFANSIDGIFNHVQIYEYLKIHYLTTNGMIILHSASEVSQDGYHNFHYSTDKEPIRALFDYNTEAVFSPENIGHTIFYVLKNQ